MRERLRAAMLPSKPYIRERLYLGGKVQLYALWYMELFFISAAYIFDFYPAVLSIAGGG
jgi:hypothetical protein